MDEDLRTVVEDWVDAYLAKLGIQGIQDTRGNFWETRGIF